ncbi:hypothetical protein AURDEDRAFT_176090 [Auricularia subglabra TFB-10046 SS5]|nr:hypothetical protein AURDEDRAFT_176090 [Auricularia subglabra TFB-10046 SS5]
MLPDELWLTIWAVLPPRDVFVISHVCRLWRALAIARPTLWCDITFKWTANSNICECDVCLPPSSLPRSTSLEYLATVISRSRMLPLRLELEVFSRQNRDVPDFLLNTFAQIAPRLEHLQVSGTSTTLARFLASTPSLPLLRTLKSAHHKDKYVDTSMLDLTHPIELPLLETLDFDGPLAWPPSRTQLAVGLTLPNIRSLSILPLDWDSVLALIDACPIIQHLSVGIQRVIRHSGRAGDVYVPERLRQRMPALRLVRPCDMTSEFLRQFQDPDLPDVTLVCDKGFFPDWWAVDIFCGVRDAAYLSLEHHGRDATVMYLQRCAISARNANGLRRALDVSLSDLHTLPRMQAYLSSSSIRSAEVHLSG